MPGIDLIGGRPGNYVLGRGKVLAQGEFAGALTGWRDVGNVTAFTVSQESETKEHQSFLTGIKTIDLEIALSTKVNISFTMDEASNFYNLAQFFSGTVTGYASDPTNLSNALLNAAACRSDDTANAGWAGSVGPIASGSENVVFSAGTVDQGLWYDLSLTFALGLGTWRAYNLDSTQTITVKKNPTGRDETTGTTMAEGVDYEIDKKMGRIRVIAASWNNLSDVLLVHWTAPSVDRHPVGALPGQDAKLEQIKMLTNSGVTVALKFIQVNPNDSDHPIEFEFFKVKLRPSGDWGGISDEWATISVEGAASSIANPPAGASPYGRITTRSVMVS